MYREFEFEYKAGGYPAPTYSGVKTFGMNVANDAPENEILNAARQRAIRIVMEYGCWSSYLSVKIISIRCVSEE